MSTERFACSFRRRQLGLDRWKDKPEPPYVEPTPEERFAAGKRMREIVSRRKQEGK